jgi:hypothetical protein
MDSDGSDASTALPVGGRTVLHGLGASGVGVAAALGGSPPTLAASSRRAPATPPTVPGVADPVVHKGLGTLVCR